MIIAVLIWLVSAPASAVELNGVVVRVIDGDTIELAGRRIRIWGIDAPELPSEPGVAAKGYLQYLMLGQEVHCEGRLLDRYRRLVAVCFLPSGEDIARLMVRAGHAVDWLRYSGGYYAR